jgi:hypothetical protein
MRIIIIVINIDSLKLCPCFLIKFRSRDRERKRARKKGKREMTKIFFFSLLAKTEYKEGSVLFMIIMIRWLFPALEYTTVFFSVSLRTKKFMMIVRRVSHALKSP